MSLTLEHRLSPADRLRSAETNGRVRSLANLNGFQTILRNPFVNNAAQVLDIWQMRHRNTDLTGVSIPGAPDLIRKLKQLPPDAEVEQYGFNGKKRAGCIFFNRQTGEFLGDTIVERRAKSPEMLAIESQLGISAPSPRSRKSA